MKRALNKLTAPAIAQAKPQEKPYKLTDGGGLYLLVETTGSRYWRLRYRMGGRERAPLALGVYPTVSLAEARKKAAEAREQIRQGIDPGLLRKAKKLNAGNTFKAVAQEWHKRHYANLSEYQAQRVWRSLEMHVFPHIGNAPVSDLKSLMFATILRRLEKKKILDVAHRTAGQMVAIMDFAVSTGLCENNPAEAPRRTLTPKPPVEHHPAFGTLPEAGAFLRKLQTYPGDTLTLHGIRLLLLTSVRTSELRFAEWQEINLEDGIWEIPSARTKMRKPHAVYLSRQAIVLFSELKTLTGRNRYVFSKPTKSGVLSENFCTQAIRRMGFHGEISGHGFRGTLSTILNENGPFRKDVVDAVLSHAEGELSEQGLRDILSTILNENRHFRNEVIEAALSHTEKNAVRAAYNHARYEPELRELWQWWADALDMAEAGATDLISPSVSSSTVE